MGNFGKRKEILRKAEMPFQESQRKDPMYILQNLQEQNLEVNYTVILLLKKGLKRKIKQYFPLQKEDINRLILSLKVKEIKVLKARLEVENRVKEGKKISNRGTFSF